MILSCKIPYGIHKFLYLFEFEITQNLASTIYQCSPSAAQCIPLSDLLS
eukprot:UN16838